MSICNYFSNEDNLRERFIFNNIAPIYDLITMGTKGKYKKAIDLLLRNVPVGGASVLDVGCGTGAWTNLFVNMGASRVVGVDQSEKMLKRAREKYPSIEFYLVNAMNMSMFDNDSFDIVTASFVLHGPDRFHRNNILSEMVRIARNTVVIHDFDTGPLPFFTKLLEVLERSHVSDFQQTFLSDLKLYGYGVSKISLSSHLALYILNKKMYVA